jgi:aryl-alcohol dehydrogenase-like predicted oxidoreductase
VEQRHLGKTRLTVSALGYGAGSVGGLFVRGDPWEQRRAIARALDASITYFDTAPSYGDGRSEENLGRVLCDLGAWNRVVVGTKVRLRPGDIRAPGGAILASVRDSLRRLGRESIDLLQFHNPIVGGGAAPLETPSGGSIALDAMAAVTEGMHEAVRHGYAAHIGFTGLGEAGVLNTLVSEGRYDTVQAYFNALNPSSGFAGASGGAQDFEGLIDRAAGAGMGVIAIRVMAAGALSAKPDRHPSAGDPGAPLTVGAGYPRDLDQARRLEALARDLGLEGPLELALRFALAKPGISTVLVGYSDVVQLEDAIRWTARGPLPKDSMRRIVEAAASS